MGHLHRSTSPRASVPIEASHKFRPRSSRGRILNRDSDRPCSRTEEALPPVAGGGRRARRSRGPPSGRGRPFFTCGAGPRVSCVRLGGCGGGRSMGSYDGVVHGRCCPSSRNRRSGNQKRTGLLDAARGTSSAIRRRGRCERRVTYRYAVSWRAGTDGARGDELALIWSGPLPRPKCSGAGRDGRRSWSRGRTDAPDLRGGWEGKNYYLQT